MHTNDGLGLPVGGIVPAALLRAPNLFGRMSAAMFLHPQGSGPEQALWNAWNSSHNKFLYNNTSNADRTEHSQ